MTQKYTNDNNISLPMAVWLAHDEYKHDPRPNHISVTALLKSTRQLILSKRLKPGEGLEDVSMLLAARLGTAVHSAIEKAWVCNYKQSMLDLGYPEHVVNNVEVNPLKPDPEKVQVYSEIRKERQIGNWVVSGEVDMICDFRVHDTKSTSVSMYTKGTKDEDYSKQMSMYRWIMPDLITEDLGFIEFIFKDWSLIKSFHTPNYPKVPVLQHKIPLMPVEKTERFISEKLIQIETFMDAEEPDIPLCNDVELWRDPPVYQYFSKATNARATKNFDSETAATSYMLQKGSGVVKTKPGKAMACLYCKAATICSQRTELASQGLLATSAS